MKATNYTVTDDDVMAWKWTKQSAVSADAVYHDGDWIVWWTPDFRLDLTRPLHTYVGRSDSLRGACDGLREAVMTWRAG